MATKTPHIRNTGTLLIEARSRYGRKNHNKWKVVSVATKNGYEKGDAMKPLPKIDWARAAIEERKLNKGGIVS